MTLILPVVWTFFATGQFEINIGWNIPGEHTGPQASFGAVHLLIQSHYKANHFKSMVE